jgi:hypothetical protein
MIWFLPKRMLNVLVPARGHGFFDDDGVVNFVDDNPHVAGEGVHGVELFALIYQRLYCDLLVVGKQIGPKRSVSIHCSCEHKMKY